MAIQAYQLFGGMSWKEIQEMEFYDFSILTTCKAESARAEEKAAQAASSRTGNAEMVKYAEEANAHFL